MAAELSHAIDLFLYKDRTSFFDDDSIAAGVIAALEPRPELEDLPFAWDFQTTCKPLQPALQYISRKLAEKELSVALIISDQEPFVIPVWPLPRKSQLILAKIVRKACSKFSTSSSWLTALAAHPHRRDSPQIFDQYKPDSYVIRRSIVQNETNFSEEGLTILSIDYIYTLKQLLVTLSKKDWIPRARDVHLSSCVHLLHRINEIYTDPKVSRGYIKRVYKEIDFHKEAWEEVNSAHNLAYCSASIRDVTTLEPDYTALSDIVLDWERSSSSNGQTASELPDTSTPRQRSSTEEMISPIAPQQRSSTEDLISPIATVDMSTVDSWENELLRESEIISPITVTYPGIKKPSSIPESPIEYWPNHLSSRSSNPFLRSLPANPTNITPQEMRKVPSPLSSLSEIDAEETEIPAALDIIKSYSDDVPAPLKTVESRDSDPLQSPFEYVKQWVESWSTSVAPGAVCANCHDLMPVGRRFTLA
ncbi:hypothetical protein MMC21_005137 [Puttea exsequens]|nr:hypothetical protein [Puttea exsequens]